MRRNVKEQVKMLLAERDIKMKELVKNLSEKFGASASLSNLSELYAFSEKVSSSSFVKSAKNFPRTNAALCL